MPSPEIFRRWAGVSGVAGALERRCQIRTNGGVLYPNLFILFVAPPGVGKDQAINPMRELWAASGKFNIAPISMTHKGLIDQLAEESSHKSIIDPETNHYESYHSLLCAVPELGVLLPAHDLGFLSALNELYNCYDLFEERIRSKGEVLRIEKPHISIISGTQPKYLGELFPEAAYGMGFTSRIIMVYAGTPVRVTLWGKRNFNPGLKDDLISDLKQMAILRGDFTITEEAAAAIESWHLHGCALDAPQHSRLLHYNARRIMHTLKLSMAFSVSESNNMVITLDHWNSALELLLETEELMPEIFKEISSGGQAAEIEELFLHLVRLYAERKKEIPESHLIHFLHTKVPANQIDFIMNTMLRAKMIKEVIPKGVLNVPGRERFFVPLELNKAE